MPDQTLDESLLTTDTLSPFLPGTNIQFAWDSTCLGLLKTCPRLYQYTIIDGWTSKDESIHLRFGLEYHQAIQEYEVSRSNGIPHEESIHDCISALVSRVWEWNPDQETKAGKYKNNRTLIGLVIDYLDNYIDDPCKTYIKADGTPAVELSFRFELDFGPQAGVIISLEERLEEHGSCGQPYLLCGHLDRVVEFNYQLMVQDHKTTTTTVGSYYFQQWEPNNQMTLYTIAGGVVLDSPIKGVVIRAAQILLDAPNRFVQGFTYRTKDQISEWLQDLEILLATAEQYASISYWPMNDTACDKFSGCKFRGICSKSPSVRNNFLKADFLQLEPDERWNPLRSR